VNPFVDFKFDVRIEERRKEIFSTEEMSKFLAVTAIGLIINVASFYFITQIKTGLPMKIWTEISIIIAALVASVWNFLCYKLLVFKK